MGVMCIRLGLCEAPDIAQNIEIGKHRGVGRPANVPAKSAWLEQPKTYTSQFIKPIQQTQSQDNSASTSKQSEASAQNIDPILPSTLPSGVEKRGRGRPLGSLNKKKKV
jgi:hypothetical protein